LYRVRFSPKGRTLAAVGDVPSLIIWDVRTGKVRRSLDADGPQMVTNLAFSPDGKYLAIVHRDEVELRDPRTGDRRAKFPTGIGGHVRALAFSPDGKMLAAGKLSPNFLKEDDLGEVVLLEVPGGAERARLRLVGGANCLAFSPDGQYLATATLKGTGLVKVWVVSKLLAQRNVHD
jgi:WD40 repeat protein